jgi:hypothetical protein
MWHSINSYKRSSTYFNFLNCLQVNLCFNNCMFIFILAFQCTFFLYYSTTNRVNILFNKLFVARGTIIFYTEKLYRNLVLFLRWYLTSIWHKVKKKKKNINMTLSNTYHVFNVDSFNDETVLWKQIFSFKFQSDSVKKKAFF